MSEILASAHLSMVTAAHLSLRRESDGSADAASIKGWHSASRPSNCSAACAPPSDLKTSSRNDSGPDVFKGASRGGPAETTTEEVSPPPPVCISWVAVTQHPNVLKAYFGDIWKVNIRTHFLQGHSVCESLPSEATGGRQCLLCETYRFVGCQNTEDES